MAWLERRGRSYRIKFRYAGKNHQVAAGTADEREAGAALARLEDTLKLLARGRLELPEGADLGLFLPSDGRLGKRPEVRRAWTLADLLAHYEATHPAAAKEANTREVERIHFAHLRRVLGARLPLPQATPATLQEYVDKRGREAFRGRPINARTVRKELGTLQTVWNWAHRQGHLPAPCPARGLVYPKTADKPPFRTYDQVQAVVGRGGLTGREVRELWDGLFLDAAQVAEVLEHVRAASSSGWLHPFLAACAYTGARRSELLRARVEDFDFAAKTVLVREKKRSKDRLTFRTVDLTPALERVMRDYFENGHPGGAYAFAADPGRPIRAGTAAKAFRRAVRKGKWRVLRGFHVFRHSFASLLAKAGVDPRVIDDLLGHQTEEMRKRYRHLFPDQRRAAVASVFGAEDGGPGEANGRA